MSQPITKTRWLESLLTGLIVICSVLSCASAQMSSIEARNQQLGRGVNFGNALEAPEEGLWGPPLEALYFDRAKEAGFETIRLPISWTYHTQTDAPYRIDSGFLERVDWAVEQALQRDLNIIVNVHHYDELNSNPETEEARFLAIWRQLAERYQDQDARVYFELLNEPHDAFDENPELWNELFAKALAVVRESNPSRAVIVGPVGYNAIDALATLELPQDPNLIVTVHFYDPFEFTHQGAEWVDPAPPTGLSWSPERSVLAWDDWSWDTQLVWQSAAQLQVTYQAGWAGFQLSGSGLNGYDILAFRTNSALSLLVGCNDETQTLNTEARWASYEVDLSACDSVNKLVIQNNSETSQAPFLLEQLELRSPQQEPLALLSTEQDVLSAKLSGAKQWAIDNERPLFVGEFGAYEQADRDSRVRWTSFVRSELERLNLPWTYWEFSAGFGVYDPLVDSWREPLLKALTP